MACVAAANIRHAAQAISILNSCADAQNFIQNQPLRNKKIHFSCRRLLAANIPIPSPDPSFIVQQSFLSNLSEPRSLNLIVATQHGERLVLKNALHT
ncbi:hypothetical protein QS306_06510 [Paraburkholderia bonniea]|uniref:hypothetical protein n=1 Tax=Paraburkholderia bonniea TaxID=2152891 RepID=UPI001291B5A9|nr:hypothetical protein [Paraburkholderia bonniea]WJF91280.1 hypothetical protein QS306_06510 [Paraburkholderia bonniea]WJF94595.1 hypothetical protein QS308_06520 [Paraburkholderia bonniea]